MHTIFIRFIIIFSKQLIYVLPDDESVRSETCRILVFFKNIIVNLMTIVCIGWLNWI